MFLISLVSLSTVVVKGSKLLKKCIIYFLSHRISKAEGYRLLKVERIQMSGIRVVRKFMDSHHNHKIMINQMLLIYLQ